MRRIFTIILLVYCLSVLAGCLGVKEGLKQFLAISTKEIEQARDTAIVKIVDYNLQDCYVKIEEILKDSGSSIYARKKDLIAVYISHQDTTPCGVFFKSVGVNKTQLEIASPASDTKEYLAEQIFFGLSGR